MENQACAVPRFGGYVDQSARRLGLALFEKGLDLAEFTVFARRSCQFPNASVSLAVIGASHLVQIRWGDAVFSELLSCTAGAVPGPVLQVPAGMAAGDNLSYRNRNLNYRFILNIESLRPGTRRLPEHLIPSCSFQTAASFPSQPGHPNAVTIVGANYFRDVNEHRPGVERAPGGVLELRSVHWYESEGVAAVSRSLLKYFKGEV